MKKIIAPIVALAVLATPLVASAHPGRTDANGGHYNRKTGEYHYHNGGGGSSSSSSSSNKSNSSSKQKTTTTKKKDSSSSTKKKTSKPNPTPSAKPAPKPVAVANPVTTPVLQVHYIDVGQGDATYIKTAAGEDILIDAGNNSSAAKVINYLKKQGVKDIEVAIATHPDADHIGGMDEVFAAFPVKSVYTSKVLDNTDAYADFTKAVAAEGLTTKTAETGVSVPIKGVTASFVGPVIDYPADDQNDSSAVLRLAYGQTSFLFTGDIEQKAENDILTFHPALKTDVLKVAHHGSDSSTSDAFLAAVAPKYAVISVGKNNSYGHPTQTVLGKLQAAKTGIYRTDLKGTVVATSNGKAITFKTERP